MLSASRWWGLLRLVTRPEQDAADHQRQGAVEHGTQDEPHRHAGPEMIPQQHQRWRLLSSRRTSFHGTLALRLALSFFPPILPVLLSQGTVDRSQRVTTRDHQPSGNDADNQQPPQSHDDIGPHQATTRSVLRYLKMHEDSAECPAPRPFSPTLAFLLAAPTAWPPALSTRLRPAVLRTATFKAHLGEAFASRIPRSLQGTISNAFAYCHAP
jgi:hypothetical protein